MRDPQTATTLAFYVGKGGTRRQRLQDWATRTATRGRESHVELIAGTPKLGEIACCLSSSGRDGGVRKKYIRLVPGNWELLTLDRDPRGASEFISSRAGAGYDYVGILLSHALPLGCHSKRRWFCSEIIAAALGLDAPHTFSPASLRRCLDNPVELPVYAGRPTPLT